MVTMVPKAIRSPWAKFSRATLIPARMSSVSMSGESEAGPMVQTILVLFFGGLTLVFMSFSAFVSGFEFDGNDWRGK